MERCKEKKAIKKSIICIYIKENAINDAKKEDTPTRFLFENYFFFVFEKSKKNIRTMRRRRIIGNNEVDITPSAEAKDI